MKFLSNNLIRFVILSASCFFISCTYEVKLNEVLDKSQPLVIQMIQKDDRTMLGEKSEIQILPGTEDYLEFINWLENNEKGWKKTIASYDPRSVIKQKNFELNNMGYFVAITYRDEQAKSHHYNKTIEIGSLDFLFD